VDLNVSEYIENTLSQLQEFIGIKATSAAALNQ
jgi:hypothetical protein